MENKIVGYRVMSGEQYVHATGTSRYGSRFVTCVSYNEPLPSTLDMCFQIAHDFVLSENGPDAVEFFGVPRIVPVERPATPLEKASKELGSILTSLCERHGLKLELTQEQIERQIAKELTELGAQDK